MKANFVVVAAAVGFFLSFIIGLLSKVSFPAILLRPLLFSFIFGAFAFGISVLFKKIMTDAPANQGFSDDLQSSGNQAATAGSVVNITIDDDALPDEEGSPKFSVEKNLPSLGSEGLSSNNTDKTSSPIQTNDSAEEQVSENASKAEEKSAVSTAPASSSTKNESAAKPAFKPMSLGAIASSSKTDNLPEIGELNISAVKNEDVISDSDFAKSSSDSYSSPRASGGKEISLDQNASVMAQAIRTVLSQDDD